MKRDEKYEKDRKYVPMENSPLVGPPLKFCSSSVSFNLKYRFSSGKEKKKRRKRKRKKRKKEPVVRLTEKKYIFARSGSFRTY